MRLPARLGPGPGAAARYGDATYGGAPTTFTLGVSGVIEGFPAAGDGTATDPESCAGGAAGRLTTMFALGVSTGMGEEVKAAGDGTAPETNLSASGNNLAVLVFCYLGLVR